MSYARRATDRRRRVLYSSHHAENEPATAASRREALRLREARRPTTAYGSRVHRRLRGRWYSLVPVSRLALAVWTVAIGAVAIILFAAHYAAVSWSPIADHPEIARALRLDRPDSFGRWVTCLLWAGCAGVSLLIYQLRRHKNDDYRGHYRVWRLFLVVMALASVDALVSIVAWAGALLDAGFGKRVALSGDDWIRIGLTVGGAVLTLRLLVEVRRSRWASLAVIASAVILMFPVAAHWNFFVIDSVERWVWVTSSPLLVSATLFLALGGYLRMLYREVRRIPDGPSLTARMREMRRRIFGAAGESEPETPSPKISVTKRRIASPDATAKSNPVAPSRGKPAVDKEVDEEGEPPKPAGRRWFGLRRAAAAAPESEADEPSLADDDEASSAKPAKRVGLGGWLKRGKSAEPQDDNDETDQPASNARSHRSSAPVTHHQGASDDADAEADDEEIDLESIDWDSMSKTERRRLRKKLKRDGRAA